jgi:hypothetical protein
VPASKVDVSGAVAGKLRCSELAAASGNAGGYSTVEGTTPVPYVSGADGPYAPVVDDETHLDEYKGLLTFVGVLGAGGDANNLQTKVINSYFSPTERYGQFVIKNDASQAFHGNGSGMFVAMIPIVDEISS